MLEEIPMWIIDRFPIPIRLDACSRVEDGSGSSLNAIIVAGIIHLITKYMLESRQIAILILQLK